MALLNIRTSKKVEATLKLEESTAKLIDRYAAYLKVSADEVVNEGMEYIFNKDRDFQQHLELHPDEKVTPSLRLKKPIVSASSTTNGSHNGAKSVAGDAK